MENPNNKVPTRVNVQNPDYPHNSNQQFVTAVVDQDGRTAHTATKQTVTITDAFGMLNENVGVPGTPGQIPR